VFRKGSQWNARAGLKHPTGIVDEGHWVKGKLSGLCKWIFRDGRTLEGEFREGRQWNARGVLKHPDPIVEEGEWVRAS
jgi:hypothetical protein